MFRLRLKFSLATTLLTLTIVAAVLVIFQQWRELRPLRSEVRRLRTEQGHLNIDDPSKIYVIEGGKNEPDAWLWRVYLPPGQKFVLGQCFGPVPALTKVGLDKWIAALKRDFGSGGTSGTGFTGELLLEARIVPHGDGQMISIQFQGEHGNGGTSLVMNSDGGDNESQKLSLAGSFGLGAEQKEHEPDEPVLLHYQAVNQPDGSREGLVLWIEPEVATKTAEARLP